MGQARSELFSPYGKSESRKKARSVSPVKIVNGTVHDPTNNLDGIVKEIWIQGGRIVAPPMA